jgi:dTDP-4-dehydrorhamnose 3,5-epimerase
VLGSEYADVMYKVDAPYSPATEGGVRYDHALLNIPWPVSNPILSAKDLKLESSYLPEL